MKRNSFFLAALVVVTTIAVAIVSCKKETENTLNQRANNVQAFDLRQIEDMNAYLKDFKVKMAENKSDESYSLNDAAWHLASLANRDFCRIDGEYDDMKFDTIEMQVKVTDGAVLMSDINAAYEQMCNEIQQFKEGFSLNNQKLYFINMLINAEGNAKIALVTSYIYASKDLDEHYWYFPDEFCYAEEFCDSVFDSSIQYRWDSIGRDELTRILNTIEHHSTNPNMMNYYIPTQTAIFSFSSSYTDPYGSPFVNDSRLFAKVNPYYEYPYNLTNDEMCYCVDSYLGLGYDYLAANSIDQWERPAIWVVSPVTSNYNRWFVHYHVLTVQYARLPLYN